MIGPETRVWESVLSRLSKEDSGPMYVMDNVPIDRETFLSWVRRYEIQGYTPQVGDLVSVYAREPSRATRGFPWGVVVEVIEPTSEARETLQSLGLPSVRVRISLAYAMPRGAHVSDGRWVDGVYHPTMTWEMSPLTHQVIVMQAASSSDNNNQSKEAA